MKTGAVCLHLTALTAAAADQALKRYVEKHYREGQGPALTGNIRICRSKNRGALLNLGEKRPSMVKAVSACTLAAGEICLLGLIRQGDQALFSAGIALILGGGASNVLDRYRQGYVTDYICFPRLPGRWGKVVFNLGDFSIFLGTAALAAACLEPA